MIEIASIAIAWIGIIAVSYLYKHMSNYTDEDMARAYTMGFDSRTKNMGLVIDKLREVLEVGQRLRNSCSDEIACQEFDRIREEIEKPLAE
jgi:hypothetical protein